VAEVTGPPWLAGLLAAAMLLIAGYAASRLATARMLRVATEADTDGLHALMGTAMAGMFLPSLQLLPSGAWAVVFGAAAASFAASTIYARRVAPGAWRCRFPLPHLVECIAMLYMLLALPAGPRPPGMAMPGMAAPGAAPGLPVLALVLALFMLGYLLWTTDRLAARARTAGAPSSHPPAGYPLLAAPLTEGSKMVMSIAMGYMLITML
jgi:Domain of unknown function (DUF5134)